MTEYEKQIEIEQNRRIKLFPKIEEDNRKMKNDITELIGIVKLYLKDYRVDKDEIQKCIKRIEIQMEKKND